MDTPHAVPMSHAQGLAIALLEKLTLQSNDLRSTRAEYTTDDLDRLDSSVLTASRSVGALRNAFAPVNILPSEVLAHIFHLLSLQTNTPPSFLPDLTTRRDPYAWISVTHVCRYWRATALAFPTLWSSIDSSSPLASLAFLARSAATPARLYLRDAVHNGGVRPCLDRARFLQAFAHHSTRLVELHVQPAFKYGPVLLRCFHAPAPELRALSLVLNLHKEGAHELPLLFGGHLPAVEKLTLANFSQWSLHQFGSRLTHLCLLDQPLRGRMPMDRFMDFLRGCELLEELVLIDAGPCTFDNAAGIGDGDKDPVALNRLRTLHIGDWTMPQAVARFLAHLVIPSTTKIFIWADCLFRRDETLSMLLPSNLEHLRPFHNLRALHLTYRPAMRDYPQLLSVQDGVLVFYLHLAMATTDEMLQSTFTPFDLGHIQELTVGIHSEPELSESAWRSIFETMPLLHTLNILRRPSRPILAALSQGPLSEDLLCPELTHLTITDDRAVSSIRLFLFAEERAQRQIPLRRLQIVSRMNMYSYRLEDEMQDMRSAIQEVVYVEDELVDVRQLPAGWPTATYRWLLDIRDGRARRMT
ncbi:hypothetical protein BDW22DRAFT_1488256 [Trametopsis cervina]|nr:hypothetical protein BDW22DRAFT_1488256 [Trametopsis cervina]